MWFYYAWNAAWVAAEIRVGRQARRIAPLRTVRVWRGLMVHRLLCWWWARLAAGGSGAMQGGEGRDDGHCCGDGGAGSDPRVAGGCGGVARPAGGGGAHRP